MDQAKYGDEPSKSQTETLLLEEDHLPGWALLLVTVLLAFPMILPLMAGQSRNLVSWTLALVITLLVLELPYLSILWRSRYRRALFGVAGVEKQIVYRIWRMKSEQYPWNEILIVACARVPNTAGADGLILDLRLSSGKKVELVRLAWSEDRIDSIRLACRELILTES